MVEITTTERPINTFVLEQAASGKWREEMVSTDLTGLTRPIRIYRAKRKNDLITHKWHGDKDTFCPPMWYDLGIGSGACGLGCRACFLMLTFRAMRDPLAHLLYDNYSDFENVSRQWLLNPARKRLHTLGVGIDRSDSLLYEGVTGHVRRLAPIFASPKANPQGNKLVLLTKTSNARYLVDIGLADRQNVVVSFSLNPEPVADLWEGKWPDTGERITPSIFRRLMAAYTAQELGYEVRVRIDPILTPEGWEDHYRDFVRRVKSFGINFRYWTLGTYREKNDQLDLWRSKWGLPAMEWQPGENEMVKEGTHRHLPEARRVEIYRTVQSLIREEFPEAKISLCKETHQVRRMVAGMCNADCNCLI